MHGYTHWGKTNAYEGFYSRDMGDRALLLKTFEFFIIIVWHISELETNWFTYTMESNTAVASSMLTSEAEDNLRL